MDGVYSWGSKDGAGDPERRVSGDVGGDMVDIVLSLVAVYVTRARRKSEKIDSDVGYVLKF